MAPGAPGRVAARLEAMAKRLVEGREMIVPVERIAQGVVAFTRKQWAAQVKAALGIDLTTDPPMAAKIQAFRNENVDLIRSLADDNINRVRLLLNDAGRVCDSSIANVFLLKNGTVSTVSLAEGCIAGVMRKNLMRLLAEKGIPVTEAAITVEELLNADEVFLTNSIFNLRWVQRIGDKKYSLNNIENDILRPVFKDPRIHFAINCAAKGCPRTVRRFARGLPLHQS